MQSKGQQCLIERRAPSIWFHWNSEIQSPNFHSSKFSASRTYQVSQRRWPRTDKIVSAKAWEKRILRSQKTVGSIIDPRSKLIYDIDCQYLKLKNEWWRAWHVVAGIAFWDAFYCLQWLHFRPSFQVKLELSGGSKLRHENNRHTATFEDTDSISLIVQNVL